MPRFKKSDRIRTKKDWARARKARRQAASTAVSISILPGEKKRLGLVVGSSVGCAVERNRIKRVLREYFRLNKAEFPQCDVILIARPPAAKLGNKELRENLKRTLGKIK